MKYQPQTEEIIKKLLEKNHIKLLKYGNEDAEMVSKRWNESFEKLYGGRDDEM